MQNGQIAYIQYTSIYDVQYNSILKNHIYIYGCYLFLSPLYLKNLKPSKTAAPNVKTDSLSSGQTTVVIFKE